MPAVEPNLNNMANPVLRYLMATRPAFLTVTLFAGFIGLASAYADGVPIDLLTAGMSLLFGLVAHAGINVLNDYYDALNGTDDANNERIFLLPAVVALFRTASYLVVKPQSSAAY
jgi:1,4-dihydroxy-2-naphthoate octaprenyltransferase